MNADVWSPGSDVVLEQEWFERGSDQQQESPWVRLFEKWTATRTWKRLETSRIRTGSVLEVGVGSGYNLAFLRSRGFDVLGCDMAPSLCRKVERSFGIAVHCGTLQSIEGEQRFDAIIMNHVLEHVSDPIDFLRNARRLLRLEGVIHIAVPNVRSWEARLPGWTSYQPYHLLYFNPKALAEAVRRAGLAVVSQGTFEPFSGWFLALVRTVLGSSPKATSPQPPRYRSTGVEWLYRILMLGSGALTFPLRKLQSAVGRGEELVMLAGRTDRSRDR